jgi:hypothetical protein
VVDEISVFELKVVFLVSVSSLPTPDCTSGLIYHSRKSKPANSALLFAPVQGS